MVGKMISARQARLIAIEFLGQAPANSGYSLVMLDEYVERPGCFVFVYESSRYLETGDFGDRLAGNAPILVDRSTGEPRFLGTANPIAFYVQQFESESPE